MKIIVACIAMAMLTLQGIAQVFQPKHTVVLPDSIQNAKSEWVDLDNDGLLDVVLLTKSKNNRYFLQFIKGDTVNSPVLSVQSKLIFSNEAYILVDYNYDNKIDVLISGTVNSVPTTVVYLNEGDFKFKEEFLNIPAFGKVIFADVDSDAKAELIISGGETGNFYTHILKAKSTGNWQVVHDSLKMKLTALEVLDADGNGEPDFFISGIVNPDSLFTGFLINQGNLYFKPYLRNPWQGGSSLSDINNDGFFDVTFTGKDREGHLVSKLFLSMNGEYSLQDHPTVLKDAIVFTADLNSNGKVDFNFFGENNVNALVNVIRYDNDEFGGIQHEDVVMQRFGDLEHDGDLDIMQLVNRSTLTVEFLENQTETKNAAPGRPFNAVALPVFNRLFMYWEKPSDDLTSTESLTYDVFLEGTSTYQVGEFDLLNEKRLTVTHGNNGSQNFKLLKGISGNVNFSIQAVDNALHAGAQCIGSGIHCVTAEAKRVLACTSERITLASPPGALWFSFKSGYLGKKSMLELSAANPDTVFYYNPLHAGCSSLKAWVIEIDNAISKIEKFERYACINSEIPFEVEDRWEQIHWTSQLRGDLGTSASITYKVSQPDSVSVTLRNAQGCTIVRKTAVKLSKPSVTVAEESYKLLKGQSVQLFASGSETYEWSPSAGLNQTNISNPIATPVQNIQYTVAGYDSLGCSDKTFVTIIVESTGFIPNLFTPNADGKNDYLKIYGLTSASNFTFSIYNREGAEVYKTNNVIEATQTGWNGISNGIKQPGGVYFWKVKGTIASGNKLLLNGKESGSIVLVR